jgi:hypothetical protein
MINNGNGITNSMKMRNRTHTHIQKFNLGAMGRLTGERWHLRGRIVSYRPGSFFGDTTIRRNEL